MASKVRWTGWVEKMLKIFSNLGYFLMVAGAVFLIIFGAILLFTSPPNPQQPINFVCLGAVLLVAGLIVAAARRQRRRKS
ncbi:hypothetical protein [Subtercola boreus]|uniref:hypothetical protein n=1 Tax=Subtercola boreus TaxID=120213 RepID=UPI001558B9FC|nr:hypothetical protein [Subtercola boreus]